MSVDLETLESYALSGSDERLGQVIVAACRELRAARNALREIARGEVSGFDLQQIAIRVLAESPEIAS